MMVVAWMIGYENGYSWSSDPEKQFHYHPTLMIISMLFITGEALVVFRVLRKETKRRTKLIHVILHTITLLFIMISLKAVWDSHRYHRDSFGKLDPLPNLYSLHSWIGIALVTIYFGQYVTGFVSFFYPAFNNTIRAILMPFHRLIGHFIFLFVGLTILMGITEFSAWHHKCWTDDKTFCAEQGLANCIGIVTLLYIGLILLIAMNPRWQRKELPEEGLLQDTENSDY
ncbi:unnamed protein product [Enterobius vermicularis]|uniref:Cytochrome b561 domain-containing protein n=1 Tax=Enterobius vermicularis TaxID=51028 RepID=A0A0N4VAK2_ENTVE|nr:unnamed protein product [Enterobius vermicularis]